MKNKMKIKLTLLLICISIVPLIILFSLYIKNTYDFYKTQRKGMAFTEIEKAAYKANTAFSEIDELVSSLIYSQYDNEYCIQSISAQENEKSELTDIERLQNYREFKYVCSNLIQNNQYAEAVYLFNKNGSNYIYTKGKDYFLETDYKESTWYKQIEENGLYKMMTFWSSSNKRVTGKYYLEIRPVSNDRGEKLSYIAVVCNTDFLNEMDNEILDDFIMIINEQGDIQYEAGNDIQNTGKTAQINKNDQSFTERKNGEYVFSELGINNWKIVSKYNLGELGTLYKNNIINLVLVIAVCIIFIIFLVLIIEKYFIDPIVRLSYIMVQVPEQNIKNKDKKYKERTDEIGVLYNQFYEMINKINILIKEQYISQINFLKEKLNGLMSQINSHFLFNTLESINCLADLDGDKRISLLSISLGDMLHYSMDFEKSEETLESEMKNIKTYIKIQEIRFENSIRVIENIPDKLKNCIVLKFMLQPIVENAVEHGLIDVENDWWIKISAEELGEKLVIRIENGGEYIPSERLEKIRKKIEGINEHLDQDSDLKLKRGHNIGLENIQRRIHIVYSRAYGLNIFNREKGGVRVEITLPLKYS